MNLLVVGSNKEPLLQNLPDQFLYLDDRIDFELPKRSAVTVLDLSRHSFNLLKGIDYRRAREFWDVLDAVMPEGKNTLTKATAELQVLEALTAKSRKPKKLASLIPDTKETAYAHQMIRKLLLSSVLENVLTRPTNFSFKGTILAKLDRAMLTDFDCFVIGNLLISQYQGPVVIPDFGFYQIPSHGALLRQNRLMAGINTFDEIEIPKFRQRLLQVGKKIASRATPKDAELLAIYQGLHPDPNRADSDYNQFIQRAIS